MEVAEYIERNKDHVDATGKRLVVRNGKAKSRGITTGAGTMEIHCPRVNDKRPDQKFSSLILPPYLRKSANVESILPVLYLKGLSGNAFHEALCGLLGENVGGLSSSSISALKKGWKKEMDEWSQRQITEQFVYIWGDGVNVKVRLGEDKKLCLLVLVGVNENGEKKLLAVESGYRESSESWKLVFNDLIRRGLTAPLIMIGDGALGLWKAVEGIPEFAKTKEQRCWVHKIANVLDKLPKRLQPAAKSQLHGMMNAARKTDADIGKKEFADDFKDKYPKAVECLEKDWDELVTFFNFPAAHWLHLRTTNPIESTFATVKLRTNVTKGAGNKEIAETMAFKLMIEAQKNWRKIRGFKEIENLLAGRVYKDGVLVEKKGERKKVA